MKVFPYKMFRVLFPGIFLMFAIVANAQPPQLSTQINKQNIIIGEQIKVKVDASFPADGYTLHWLDIPDSIDHFEVIERSKIDSVETNGMLKVQQIITLTSFDSGQRTIPSFPVNFSPINDDTTLNLFTDSIRINVSFSPMDSTKTFHDIKTIIDVEDKWPLWMWIAAALSLLLLIFLVYYLIKNLRKKKSKDLFTSKLSPLDEALQSLDELQKENLLNNGYAKQFHSRLTDIFKRFISRKTNSNLQILTTEEILLRLNELQINKQDISIMANNLRMADAVKFAKFIPSIAESEDALAGMKKIIQHTDHFISNTKSDS